MQPLHNIKVALCGPEVHASYIEIFCIFIMLVPIHRNNYQIWLINECARKILVKRSLCDLSRPLRLYLIFEFFCAL